MKNIKGKIIDSFSFEAFLIKYINRNIKPNNNTGMTVELSIFTKNKSKSNSKKFLKENPSK